MRNNRLNDQVKVVMASLPAVTAVGAIAPVEVDGTGYHRAYYILATGAAGATASTIALKVQDSATSGGSLADLPSAASAGLTKAANVNKIQGYDCNVNPARPFQKITGSVGTDTFATAIICILYNRCEPQPNYPVATAYATELIVA